MAKGRAFSVIGWDLERFDPEYVISRIREAAAHGVNTISLSHDIVMNAEEILYDWHRYKYLRAFCQEAHDHGMQVFLWNHQINQPPEELVRLDEDGVAWLDYDHPKLWEWLHRLYQRVVDRVPELDGIILSLTESVWQIHRGPEDPRFFTRSRRIQSALSPDERMAKLISTVRDSLASRGKGLWVRDFLRSPKEMEHFLKAMERVPSDVGVFTKCVPNDWQYKYPPHPLLGKFPERRQVMEIDLYNETGGNIHSILLAPEYYQAQIRLARELRLAGVVPRLDDTYRTTRGSAREFNLFVYNRLIHDPDLDVEPLWMEFFERYCGSRQAAEVAVDVLRRTFDLVCANVYTLGQWTGYRAPSIGYTDSHLENHCTSLWSDDPKYKEIEVLLKTGGPQAIAAVSEEKRRAEEVALDALAALEGAKELFTPEVYLELTGYFEELVQSARINRVWAKAYFAFRYYRSHPDSAQARAEAEAALAEVMHFLESQPILPQTEYQRSLERKELERFWTGGLRAFARELGEAMATLRKGV